MILPMHLLDIIIMCQKALELGQKFIFNAKHTSSFLVLVNDFIA